jgi:hypothetical protein
MASKKKAIVVITFRDADKLSDSMVGLIINWLRRTGSDVKRYRKDLSGTFVARFYDNGKGN